MPEAPVSAAPWSTTPWSAAPWGDALAAWIVGARTFPAAARAVAGRALVDVTGCMVAGAHDPAARAVRAACAAWGDGSASLVGAAAGQSAPWAALANGTAAHALDFDDNFDPAKAHITAVLMPALLALAEVRGLSGRAVIDGYIVGTEIAARLGRAFNPRHRDTGWHATSTLGPIAAAGACARLIGLDAAATAHALNAATSFAGGTVAQFGSGMKAVHAGRAAAAGVMAAAFAAAGIDAGAEALDGPHGLAVLMAGRGAAPPEDEAPLALIADGLKVKPYPTCASAHRAIDAVLALRAAHKIEAERIVRIDVHAPQSHLANLMHVAPRNPREARFSLGYCLAVAALRGGVTLRDFTAATFADPVAHRFARRVNGHGIPLPETAAPTRVDIGLDDGTVLSATVDAPKGRADNPLTDAELWQKFAACCDGIVSPERRAAIAAALRRFDGEAPASELMALLRA
jgi:2-methylcitrate dehydratase PrpD